MHRSFTADVVGTATTLTLRNTAWQSVAASVSGPLKPVAVFLSLATDSAVCNRFFSDSSEWGRATTNHICQAFLISRVL